MAEGPLQKKLKEAPLKDVKLFGRSIYTPDSEVGTHHTIHILLYILIMDY